MNVKGIHHVGLVVDDLDAAVGFYGSLLRMEVIERDSWRAPDPAADSAVGLVGSSADGAMMRGSGSFLELWQYHEPAPIGNDPARRGAHERGLRHLAIEVDDVDEALARVVELGGAKMGEPIRSGAGAAAVYCRDPFGTIIELMSTGSELASLDDLASPDDDLASQDKQASPDEQTSPDDDLASQDEQASPDELA